MELFLIRLLIVIGLVWLTQFLLGVLNVQEPPRSVILVIVVIILLFWFIGGVTAFRLG